MNFYPFHIGDYLSHTRHLTVLEDVAYRRMLDVYYTHERPLTGTPTSIARLIGMSEHEQSVSAVLSEFFDEQNGAFRNSRADREIESYQSKVSMRVKAGKASAKARRKHGTHVQHVSNVCSTHDEHTGTGTGNGNGTLSSSGEGEVQERERSDAFERFWTAFDYKKGRKKAYQAWAKVKRSDWDEIIRVAGAYRASITDQQFQKHPATWLNGECWNDAITVSKNGNGFKQHISKCIDEESEGEKETRRRHQLWIDGKEDDWVPPTGGDDE